MFVFLAHSTQAVHIGSYYVSAHLQGAKEPEYVRSYGSYNINVTYSTSKGCQGAPYFVAQGADYRTGSDY